MHGWRRQAQITLRSICLAFMPSCLQCAVSARSYARLFDCLLSVVYNLDLIIGMQVKEANISFLNNDPETPQGAGPEHWMPQVQVNEANTRFIHEGPETPQDAGPEHWMPQAQ